MTGPALAYAIAAACYLGFQWTIRLVVYPQFARAGGFVAYHAAHSRLVSIAVAPLFAALGVTSLAVLVTPPSSRLVAALAPTLFVALLGVTALGAVPQHRRLGAGFDPAVHRRLVAVDTVRLALAAAATALGVAWCAGA